MKKIRLYLLTFVLLLSFVSLGIFSCSKKKKLTLSSLVITVLPNPATVKEGENETFTATALRNGSPESVDFTWSVSPSTMGTITALGVFTGSEAGSGTVVASAEGESGSADVTVTPGGVIIPTLPCYIHKDKDDPANHYAPSIWWDDATAFFTTTWDCPDVPPVVGGNDSLKIEYLAGGAGWGELGWIEPHDNDGNNYSNGGYDLTGATKLTFWAKCDTAGHQISVIVADFETAAYPDSTAPVKLENINLQTIWTQYEIDLTGKDLSKIQFGLLLCAWTPPYTFYIDEIKFEQ